MSEENFIKEDEAARLEEWRPIKGYEDLYWVSNFGRIKNKKRILNPFLVSTGYYKVTFQKNRIQKILPVHRLVGIAFISNRENLPVINHKDSNKLNNNVENLEWTTIAGNNRHYQNYLNLINQQNENATIIRAYDYNGNIICEYKNIQEAMEQHKISPYLFYKYLDQYIFTKIGLRLSSKDYKIEYHI